MKLFQRLFDALIRAAMTYGAEIFAMSPRMDLLVGVERQFYRKIYGLSNGVAGVALEAALGITNVEVSARLKSLVYWHKLAYREGNELLKLACLQQKEWADQGLSCWGLDIKKELEKNGLGFLWENPRALPGKKFKSLTKQRLEDVKFQETVCKLADYPSARYLRSLEPNRVIPCQRIQRLKSEHRRRSFLKVLFEAHEDLICRETEFKTCRDCGEMLEYSVMKHRLFACEAMKGLRKSLDITVSAGIEGLALKSYILRKIEGYGGYKWAQIIESVHEKN